MRCQVCGKDEQVEGTECRFCAATVRSVLGRGMPLPPGVRDELQAGRRENRERQSARRRSRLIWHTAVGAIVLFGVAVWVNVAAFFFTAPKLMLLGILRAVPVALIFGPPIGFITSWRNFGPVGGAAIGTLFFAGGTYLIGGGSPLACLIIGVLAGVSVGGLIGLHVRSDTD